MSQAYTTIYKLGYLQPYQKVGEVLSMDETRFQTIERQLYWLYSIFGNGVLDNDPLNPSWRIQVVPSDTTGTKIQITPGQGNVNFCSCQTTQPVVLTLPSVTTTTTFWIYATPNATTTNLGTVDFVALLTEVTNQPNIYVGLGGVIATVSNNKQSLSPQNTADYGRVDISIFSTIANYVNKHHHLGGSNNPSQINLQTEVQNKLSGDFIDFIDLSKVTQGTLDPERLPPIPHESLLRIGTLSHPQIDSLLDSIQYDSDSRLSDLAVSNLLILGLGFRRLTGLGTIDAQSINEVLYTPGITPDYFSAYYANYTSYGLDGVLAPYVPSYIPLATIDKTNRRIVGTAYTIPGGDQITYTTLADFNRAVLQAQLISSGAVSNIEVVDIGDGAFTLSRPLNYQGISNTNLSPWTSAYKFLDESTKTPTSPPATNFNDNYDVNRYLYLPFTQPQDWSSDDKIEVGFSIATGSVLGAVSMFLILSSGGTATQVYETGSNTEVSINISNTVIIQPEDQPAASGLTYTTNLSNFITDPSQLTQVNGVGFVYSTTSGWNKPQAEFSLYVPDASEIPDDRVVAARASLPDTTSAIFIWNTVNYSPTGTLTFRFDSNYDQTQYSTLDFDAEATLSSNISILTRVANDTTSLLSATPYSVDSTTHQVDSEANIGRYIDIIVNLTASDDLLSAPTVDDLTLSFMSPGVSNMKTWSQKVATLPEDVNAWSKANLVENIAYVPNSDVGPVALQIADASSVGNYTYIRGDGWRSDSDESSSSEQTLQDGSLLYQTPYQAFNGGVRTGFESPSDIWTLSDGSSVVADTLNDRLVQLDSNGKLVRAIQGNVRLQQTSQPWVALTATFNPRLGQLWVTFSQDVTVSDKTKISLTSGSAAISFSDSAINIVPFQPDGQGKSATLVATFSAAQTAIIEAWTNPVNIIFANGSVANAGTSTGVPTGGTTGSLGGSTGGVTTGGSGSNSCGFPDWFIPLFDNLSTVSFAGAATCPYKASGLTLPSPPTTGTGSVWSTTTTSLQGPNGQVGQVMLPVIFGEITFDRLFNPVSIQLNNNLDWITGTAGPDGVISYGSYSERLYSLPHSLVPLRETYLGSAWELSNQNVLVGVPAGDGTTDKGAVYVYNVLQGNVLVTQAQFFGDVVRAIPTDDELEYWVAIDDRQGDGQTSRVVRLNTTGRVDWIWGVGVIAKPSGLALLENQTLVVSE